MGRKATDKKRAQNPAKKQEMVQALLPYFMENGLKEGTMDDAAFFLGKSKATIYKYFESREEMVRMGLEWKLGELKGFVPMLSDQSMPYLDRYFSAMEHFSSIVSDISNIFLSDLQEVYPNLWQVVEQFQQFAALILDAFYQEGVKTGILKPIHKGVLVLSDQFLFRALSQPQFLHEHNLTIREAFENYFEMKFFGLVQAHNPARN